jgi:hypothetical protein
MARKVFAAGGHAAAQQAGLQRQRQFGHHVGVTMEGAVANHRAARPVQFPNVISCMVKTGKTAGKTGTIAGFALHSARRV